MDIGASFESYQHSHHHHSHLVMPKPLNHTSPASYDSQDQENSNGPNNSSTPAAAANYSSIPSPISPRTTRCPSLTNSIYSSSSSASSTSPTRGSFPSSVASRDVLRYTHDSSRIGKPYSSVLGVGVYHHAHHVNPHHHHHQQQPHHHEEKISKHEKRRRNHLNSEKKRRENIKSGMDALFELVPACRDQQESKANILKKTKDFILELQSAVYGLAEENKELKRRGGVSGQLIVPPGSGKPSRSRL